MSTVYTDMNPDGLGATLARAVESGVTRVVVCGPRPGKGKTGAREWGARSGAWVALGAPHVTRSTFRGRFGLDGREVAVTRAEPWFGSADAATVADAAPVLRHCLMRHGQAPMPTPSRTGLALLARLSPEYLDVRCPADVGELLRDTSGQGRFQVWGCEPGSHLVGIDARWQYAALALCELPTGLPTRGTEPGEYDPSWLHVQFTPTGPLGVLGVKMGDSWTWPTNGANWTTWATGAEVQLARRIGYTVNVLDSLVWPTRGRPLAKFARALIGERQRVESMALPDAVVKATRTALRAVLVQTIGSIHSGGLPSLSATADKEGSTSHPEWTTALYGLARHRLAVEMLAQTAPVVACALDGYYVQGEPVTRADHGKPGAWVESGRFTTVGPIANLADLYRETGAR